MNIIITSEQRVGSRWIHYLLADLLGYYPSPEIDVKNIEENLGTIQGYFKQKKIVKFHRATSVDIFSHIKQDPPYSVIGIVRNPRDRIVSQAFHNRYHKNHVFPERKFKTDREAVKYTFNQNWCQEANERQFLLMFEYFSTRTYKDKDRIFPYIWTSYEWMKENTEREMRTILKFLHVDLPDEIIKIFVESNSFKVKSGREPGKEIRSSLWRRKGINNDWKNWFTTKMIEQTEEIQQRYFEILEREDGFNREIN